MKIVKGNIVDIFNNEIYFGEINIVENIIFDINKMGEENTDEMYIIPGFVDSHMHIESSMLTPYNFSKLAVKRGSVAVVNDPHEIANVMGTEGIEFMIEDAKQSLIKMFFTIPSCVPATKFDSAGAVLNSNDMECLLKKYKFVGISEMMNIPGVIYKDEEVLSKINIGKKYGIPIDGHAPELRGKDLSIYAKAGIGNDHESVSLDEALEKIDNGMKILIREGSAAKNYNALKTLINTNPNDVMFCTDDSHPQDIINKGHIDKIVKKALNDGFNIFDILRASSLNPVEYYKLDVGLLRKNDKADFIIVDNLNNLNTIETYINGEKVYDKSYDISENKNIEYSNDINNFNHQLIDNKDIIKKCVSKINYIKLNKNELITDRGEIELENTDNLESYIEKDILKIVYINRYNNGKPQVSYISGFGLKSGAIASSIGHDSHNIVAVGCSDDDIISAVNEVINARGGLSISNYGKTNILELPIAGIISDKSGEEVAEIYEKLDKMAINMGTKLDSPFMTLAFMSLIVIPYIKIGERGLFDFNKFDFINE